MANDQATIYHFIPPEFVVIYSLQGLLENEVVFFHKDEYNRFYSNQTITRS